MTKNNLKVVKSDNKKQQELKEKNKSLEAAISQIDQNFGKGSADTLRSYARLEITSMERGLFLLEVVVSAAPLLGLLGTVTGLVKVFSQIPAGGGVGDTAIFSEGIAMALLTTIAGLAIAIPTLISHSYLARLIDKRASSISWLTERLVDAVYPKDETNHREIS